MMTTTISIDDAQRLILLIKEIANESYKEGLTGKGSKSLEFVEDAVRLIALNSGRSVIKYSWDRNEIDESLKKIVKDIEEERKL